MDAISYSYADKQAKRIKKFIENPDSTSGVLTVPKVIAAGETITIPAGRMAILPNVQVDGTLDIQGEVFIPSGAITTGVVEKVTSTDNAIVRFNGTTGDVQNSGVVIDDNGNVGIRTNNPAFKLHVVESSIGTVAKFENTITNKSSQAGITINTNNASSSAGKGLFYDFRNENNISIGGVHCDVNTDGSSEIWFDTTPAGVRTSDRRVIAGRFTRSGDLLLTSGTGLLGYGTGAGVTVTQLTSKSTDVTLNKPTGQIAVNNSALAGGASVYFDINNSLVTINDNILVTLVTAFNSSYRVEVAYIYNGRITLRLTNITAGSLSESPLINVVVVKGVVS